jgi:hypothetical protein
MKSESFQEFKIKIEKELRLTEDNIEEKSIQLSNIYSNVLSIYSKELKIFKNMQIEKDKIYGELYHKYKFEFDYQLDSKSEVDSYIKSNELYYKLALECANQEVQVKFLEQTLEHINNLGFRIKNYIDLKKISKGLI